MIQQQTNGIFDYREFKCRVAAATMTPAELASVDQRLENLEAILLQKPKDEDGTSWMIQVCSASPMKWK